ncbi:hypothetical protein CLOSPO_02243 [Clostridium sporogenes ATCC 15579]|nr:hypothetical protein CLOSPO_02243 [Clostridium sporogenes ATCC 15579]
MDSTTTQYTSKFKTKASNKASVKILKQLFFTQHTYYIIIKLPAFC